MIMVIPYSNLNPAELWMGTIVWSHLCLCDLEEGGAKVSQVGTKEKRDRRIPKHWLVCFICMLCNNCNTCPRACAYIQILW